MVALVDLVEIYVRSSGTGALSLGEAVPGNRGIEALTDGEQYRYSIRQSGEYEVGTGTWLASSGILTRVPLFSSRGNEPISVVIGSSVAFTALAADYTGEASVQAILDATALAQAAAAAALEAAAKVQAGVWRYPTTGTLPADQAVFTLPFAPTVPVYVYIGGVRQDNAARFTVDGDQLTLDPPALAGQYVTVVIGEAALQPIVPVDNVDGLDAKIAPLLYTLPTRGSITAAFIPPNYSYIYVQGYAFPGDGGDFYAKSVDSEPTHAGKYLSANGRWFEITNQVLNAKQFGANGTAGDDAKFQAMFDCGLARGVRQFFAPSLLGGVRYQFNNPVRWYGGQTLYGDGQTGFKRNGAGACFIVGDIPDPSDVGVLLSANGDANSRVVTVADATDFSPNDVVILRSDEYCHSNTPMRRAEFAVIRLISGNNLTLSSPLFYQYNTSAGASVTKVSMTDGPQLRDLDIEMDPTIPTLAAGTQADYWAIHLRFCMNAVIRNVSMSWSTAPALGMVGCLTCDIDVTAHDLGSADDDATGARSDGTTGGYGYGVNERGLNFGNRIRVRGLRVRHAYSTTAEFFDVFKWGMPTFTRVWGSDSIASKEAGFDTHESGESIMFDAPRSWGAEATGLQNRSKRTFTINPFFWGTSGNGYYSYGANTFSNAAGDEGFLVNPFIVRTNLGPPRPYHDNQIWPAQGAIRDQGFNNVVKGGFINRTGGGVFSTNTLTRGSRVWGLMGLDICQLAPSGSQWAVDYTQNGADRPVLVDMFIKSTDGKVTDLVRTSNFACIPQIRDIKGEGNTGVDFSSSVAGMNRNISGGFGMQILSGGYRSRQVIAAGTVDLKNLDGSTVQLEAESGPGADDLTAVNGMTDGDVVRVTAFEGNTITLVHSAGLRLKGAVNVTIAQFQYVTFLYTEGTVVELSRSF